MFTWLRYVGIVGVASIAPLAAAENRQASYAQVKLISLKCMKSSDGVGADEPYLALGASSQGIRRLWEGKGATAGSQFDLTGAPLATIFDSAPLSLMEHDAFNDDHIGTAKLKRESLGKGTHEFTYLGVNDASEYELKYEIVKPKGRCARFRIVSFECVDPLASSSEESDNLILDFDKYQFLLGPAQKGSKREVAHEAIPFCGTAPVTLNILSVPVPTLGDGPALPSLPDAAGSNPLAGLALNPAEWNKLTPAERMQRLRQMKLPAAGLPKLPAAPAGDGKGLDTRITSLGPLTAKVDAAGKGPLQLKFTKTGKENATYLLTYQVEE